MTIAAQDKPTALQEQSTPQSGAIIENPPSLVRRLGLNRPWIVILAAAYLVVVVLVAIFAPFLQPYEHTAQDLSVQPGSCLNVAELRVPWPPLFSPFYRNPDPLGLE